MKNKNRPFGDMHCDKYLVSVGRICDKPATNLTGMRARCDEHNPYFISKIEAAIASEGK